MAVYALWSVARSRSTAFFRSMVERGDLRCLHEPLEGIVYTEPLELDGRRFATPDELIDWMLDKASRPIFTKETLAPPVIEAVRSRPRYLAEARHAFLIRRPEEIAASFLALEGDLRIMDTGVEALHELYRAVLAAGGHRPVVIDSDDLVAQPGPTMQAYCDAVGLPFLPAALRWDAGVRSEWSASARWHTDASASTAFRPPERRDRHGLLDHPDVVRFADRHRPAYEALRGLCSSGPASPPGDGQLGVEWSGSVAGPASPPGDDSGGVE